MSTSTVPRSQRRFNRNSPCPICGGHAFMPHGRGVRCYGYFSGDRLEWAYCTREEYGKGAPYNDDAAAYCHRLGDAGCQCGSVHQGPVAVPVMQAERVRETPLPPPPVLDALFRAYLALCPLRPEHLDYMAARGPYDAAAAELHGYGSLPRSERDGIRVAEALRAQFGTSLVASMPGIFWVERQLDTHTGDAVVIPARDEGGQITALVRRFLDPEVSGARYMTFSGAGGDFATVAGERSQILYVTEGIHKAHVAALAGHIYVLGTPGAFVRDAHLRLITRLHPRYLIEALDADKTANVSVAKARAEIVRRLASLGVPVRTARWPIESGKGLDDVLAAGHTVAGAEISAALCDDLVSRLKAAAIAQG